MKTYLNLKNSHNRILPKEFQGDDVRYTDELVEYFLLKYTNRGDIVFDPFMGYGTTLVVAEKLNRIAFGVEIDSNRCSYVKSIVQNPNRALHADSTKLNLLKLPQFNFSITSPPYMGRPHQENPFTGYTKTGYSYEEYLATIRSIYSQINENLAPAGRIVIEVANLKHEDGSLTTLAWDIAIEVSKILKFEGETIVIWENSYGYGYDHSYCLNFTKKFS